MNMVGHDGKLTCFDIRKMGGDVILPFLNNFATLVQPHYPTLDLAE
jgi:hypothetical protein